ncbi:secretion system protein [Stenotrophomonas pictorum JCM 9942]|jgi:prepilin-type N-terminal cleavage/methylation domain-containing protein|uniref:Secretion system protein n=2 Tax=Stenotrophomonas pictorum TaxID=86184 RepID=A0A0R0ASG5_9GAMM|nr:prepilin-type N-terminal cleavage/methylation domain-containing protein [Stenotrophomonas pictorum]KRG44938.1 secretion system protein [Stenotrophomonas pictorum JCM 9942]
MQIRSNRRQGGFTLVEMAVVLVIIGVIIGAVMIGRDVQRNAEYTRIKQKFVDQWVVGYNSYHQRFGAPVGDNQAAPRLMVAGIDFNGAAGSLSGGDMAGATSPGAICNAAAPQGITAASTNGLQLRDMMRRAGISLPPGRGEGFEDRYVYLDTNGNPQEVQVCFQWNPPGTGSGSGNVMVISGLTPDLARSLDQMIDGKPDPQSGAFRQQGVAAKTATDNANTAGIEWQGNNTEAFNTSGSGTAGANGTNTDTEQVLTMTAHYKMNQ